MTFDLQAARAICDKLASGKDAIDIDYQNALAAEMLEKLLDALDFQPGDADILYWMLTGVGDDPTQDEIAELLSRYQAMASKMTEERK